MMSISRFLGVYRVLNEYTLKNTPNVSQVDADAVWHFLRPYVCVIHNESGRGYYLDRQYHLIVSVNHIPTPGKPSPEIPNALTRVLHHETLHQQAGANSPEWAADLPSSEFTSYWLY